MNNGFTNGMTNAMGRGVANSMTNGMENDMLPAMVNAMTNHGLATSTMARASTVMAGWSLPIPQPPTQEQIQQQINPVIVEDEFMSENSNSPKLLEPDQTLEDVVEQSALLTNNCNSTSTTSTTTLGNIELVSDNLLDEDVIEPDQTARIENAKIKAPTGRSMTLRAIRVLGSLFLFLFIFTIFLLSVCTVAPQTPE